VTGVEKKKKKKTLQRARRGKTPQKRITEGGITKRKKSSGDLSFQTEKAVEKKMTEKGRGEGNSQR